MIKGVVLDLDDTIYLERDYVRSGFRAVAAALEDDGHGAFDAFFEQLWIEFEAGRRGDAFDALIDCFGLSDDVSVEDLVAIYRDHSPDITVREPSVLGAVVESERPLALISDGLADTQQRKLSALGVDALFSPTVLTGAWGRAYWKPHARAFKTVEELLELEPYQLVYVGDNPRKDFITPKARGWLTIRLRMPGQLHFEAEPESADFVAQKEISSLHELLDWI